MLLRACALGLLLSTACSTSPPPIPHSLAAAAPSAARAPPPTARKPAQPSAPSPAPSPPRPDATPQPDPRDRIREELGPEVAVLEEAPFLLAGPGWQRSSLAAVAQLVRRALDALYAGRFSTRPERAVAVYLFPTSAPYEGFCKERLGEPCMSPFGFYRPDARTIVMNAGPGIGTLTHEIVHPLVEADFPGAPTWIDEGIASLFEAPVLPHAAEIHGAKNWRLPRLRGALTAGKGQQRVRLDALFGMSDETFRDRDESLHYAMARYACQWLDGRGKLWPFYQAWRDGVRDDPTGEKAFERIVGKTPADANVEWARWVRAL